MKTIKILFAIVIVLLANQSVNAQKVNAETNKGSTTIHTYSCPIHPDVTSDKEGNCSKCGMNLNLSPKGKIKMEVMKIYSCPMHPEIMSNNPGKCSKCNMDLTKEKTKPAN